MKPPWITAIRWYYLATPVFLLLDALGAPPVRVAFLDDIRARLGYYAFVFALGLLCRWRPRTTPWIGMGESALNFFLLLLGVLWPLWALPEIVAAGGPVMAPFTAASMVNVVLSGGVFIASFHRNQAEALQPLGRS